MNDLVPEFIGINIFLVDRFIRVNRVFLVERFVVDNSIHELVIDLDRYVSPGHLAFFQLCIDEILRVGMLNRDTQHKGPPAAILRNFPVLGHLRYLLEEVGPELRQYIVTSDIEEKPFNRDQRSWIYASSKRANNYFAFGTSQDLELSPNYPIIKHSPFPLRAPPAPHRTQR